MTPGEKIQIDLADAHRRLNQAPNRASRKYWKQVIYDLTEESLELRGLVTRTHADRFGPPKTYL